MLTQFTIILLLLEARRICQSQKLSSQNRRNQSSLVPRSLSSDNESPEQVSKPEPPQLFSNAVILPAVKGSDESAYSNFTQAGNSTKRCGCGGGGGGVMTIDSSTGEVKYIGGIRGASIIFINNGGSSDDDDNASPGGAAKMAGGGAMQMPQRRRAPPGAQEDEPMTQDMLMGRPARDPGTGSGGATGQSVQSRSARGKHRRPHKRPRKLLAAGNSIGNANRNVRVHQKKRKHKKAQSAAGNGELIGEGVENGILVQGSGQGPTDRELSQDGAEDDSSEEANEKVAPAKTTTKRVPR